MSAHSIDSQILRSLPLLEPDQKKSLLSVIKSFLKQQETLENAMQKEYQVGDNEPKQLAREDFISQYNRDIAISEQEINDGEIIPHEDIEKESESW